MKHLLTIAAFLFILTTSYAGSFIEELENSLERARKGSKVQYILHLGKGEEHIITGQDFTSGEVIRKGEIPLYFELNKGKGDKKYSIMINLQNAKYYQLFVEKDMGEWEYIFHFYY